MTEENIVPKVEENIVPKVEENIVPKVEENVLEGRESNGQFAKNNQLAVGNATKKFGWRVKLYEAAKNHYTPEKIEAIFATLYKKAKKGNIPAIKVWLSRGLGEEPLEMDITSDQKIEFTFVPAGKKEIE